MTNPVKPHDLPTLALDYHAGTMTNTLTGETSDAVYGVIIGQRDDRVLWPTLGELPRLPLCVNGSDFGPCPCGFADWGKDGTPPDCSEELSVLLADESGSQVAVLTARRGQVKTLERYLDMKAFLGGLLHDQFVTIRMQRDDTRHRLVLLPGTLVPLEEQAWYAAMAERIAATGAFAGLG